MQFLNKGIQNNLWTKKFLSLIFSNGLLFSGFHLLMPTIPLYAAQQGGSSSETGLVAGIFVLSAIVIRFFTGWGIKKWGKKRFLCIGILISVLSASGYSLISSMEMLFSIRVLHGIGFGIATTLYATIASDMIPANRRGEGMGYFGLGTTVAMAIGPATGIWLVNAYGFNSMFAVALICQIFAFLWTAFSPMEERVVIYEQKIIATDSAKKQTSEKLVSMAALLTILFGLCYGSVLNFIALFSREMQIDNPGAFFLVGTFCICLSRGVTGRIFDSKGHMWVIYPGAILFLAGFVILAQTTSFLLLLVAAVLYGLGVGALFPALQTWMLNQAAPEKRGTANAAFYNMLDIGVGGGSVLLGFLVANHGFASVYAYSIGTMVLFLAVYSAYLFLTAKAAGKKEETVEIKEV